MSKRRNSTPTYRKHTRSGQAVVTLNGKDHYLGKHGTAASREAYDRLIAQWLAHDRQLPDESGLTVVELIAAFRRHAKAYYIKDGRETPEVTHIEAAMRPLRRLYGRTPTAEFGPLAFKTVRNELVKAGSSRKHVNDQAGRIKRMFRWGVENELVPPSVYHGLQAVAGLKRGRTAAPDHPPVRPVPEEYIGAVRPYLSRQLGAVVELQRLTGMRPTEALTMRAADVDMTGTLWLYRPASHKTQHHGHDRLVELGPKAQKILREFLKPDLHEYLFSPKDAVADRPAKAGKRRRPGQKPNRRQTGRVVGDCYEVGAYRRAIARACTRAEVPQWSPHQLRHNYATKVRKDYGIEAARILLGHRSAVVSELYAEIDRGKVQDIVRKIG